MYQLEWLAKLKYVIVCLETSSQNKDKEDMIFGGAGGGVGEE